MLNTRLLEHYDIDSHKDLGIPQVCARPFDTLLVDSRGSCFACECTAWLPVSVGNLHRSTLEEILGSQVRHELQESVSDGTYRYCNDRQCPYLTNRTLTSRRDSALREIRLGIDDSCNLSCPSCRRTTRFIRSGKMFQMRMALCDRIVDYLESRQQPIRAHIGADGDPFASLVYRRFMKRTQHMPWVTYSLQTNGLLCKQMYTRVKPVFERLESLNISIDGASKHTYETLRRGGSWEKINANLQFLQQIRQEHGFRLSLHMVVQRGNWHEMMDMCELGQRYGVDHVVLNKIQDWQTIDDFNAHMVPEGEHISEIERKVKDHPLSILWGNNDHKPAFPLIS